eukprot:ctg_2189.g347
MLSSACAWGACRCSAEGHFRRSAILASTATASSSSQAQPLYPPADAKTETRAPSERPPTFPVSFGTPRMMVLGLGGAGGNAVNNMVRAARPKGGSSSTNNNSSAAAQAHGAARYDGVRFMAANTDARHYRARWPSAPSGWARR